MTTCNFTRSRYGCINPDLSIWVDLSPEISVIVPPFRGLLLWVSCSSSCRSSVLLPQQSPDSHLVSTCHPVILSSCHLVFLPLCHLIILSPSCHLVILLYCYHVTLSSCYHVILSFCHLVIILSSYKYWHWTKKCCHLV